MISKLIKCSERNIEFIEHLPKLNNAIRIAFDRHPQDISLIDGLVYDLSQQGVARYSEIGLLCSNGLGNASFIILRSMFEYLVTAKYLHLHPEKSFDFVDYLYVHLHTMFSQIRQTYGILPHSRDFERRVEENYNKVKERYSFKGSRGKERKRLSWSDKNIINMAMDAKLGDYIVPAYYLGIEVAHPSISTLVNVKNDALDAASQALMISHRMLIELISLQHEHFGLDELKPIIGQCLRDFRGVWKEYIQESENGEA